MNNIRPSIVRRRDYKPLAPAEQFIVPLLKTQIESALTSYAFPAPTQGKVIDIGCGQQPFRGNFESAGYSYFGLDVEQNSEGTIDFVGPIDQDLPFNLLSQKPFEFVMCTEVLEHVADWSIAFKNITSLLAPGGRVLVTCPHFYQLHEVPYDYWRPTLYALEYFGNKNSLKILEKKMVGDPWDVLGTLLANCYSSPASVKITDRILSRFVNILRTKIFKLLLDRRLQSCVRLNGSAYLSNVIIFERV